MSDPTAATRRLVFARAELDSPFGPLCDCCGLSSHNWEVHHRCSREMGGTVLEWKNHAANLLLLRPSCHRWWTDQPVEARKLGMIISAHTGVLAADVPLLWRGKTWVRLDDSGGFDRSLVVGSGT